MQTESSKSTGQTCDDGGTCEPSRPNLSTNGESTSSVEGSPAKTFPTPDEEQDLVESEAGCFSMPFAWFDNSDPKSCCWRTWQRYLLGGWTLYSDRWGRSGMTRNGIAYRLPPLVPRISGTGYLYLPTPNTGETENSHGRRGRSSNANHQSSRDLDAMAATGMWPTPTTQEVEHPEAALTKCGKRRKTPNNRSHSLNLADAVKMWPTPRAFMHKDSTTERGRSNLGEIVGGQLSPGFVEWLMGFPRTFTEVIDHETKHDPHASAAGVPEVIAEEMPAVRDSEGKTTCEAPPRLLKAAGSGDTLPSMPREGGPGSGVAEKEAAESMQGLRGDVYAESQQKPHNLLWEVLVSVGKEECYEAMAGTFSEAELLELRDRIRAAEGQGDDVLSIMRKQARVEETQSNPWESGEWPDQPRVETGVPNRVDRLRCLGNAIVPQVAEWIGRRIINTHA
jgi:hypothetical protein